MRNHIDSDTDANDSEITHFNLSHSIANKTQRQRGKGKRERENGVATYHFINYQNKTQHKNVKCEWPYFPQN